MLWTRSFLNRKLNEPVRRINPFSQFDRTTLKSEMIVYPAGL